MTRAGARVLLLALPLLLLSACGCPPAPLAMNTATAALENPCKRYIGVPQSVALSELISNGRAYEGRAVSVTGYYSYGFEHSALYADAGVDMYAHDFSKGIWINSVPRSAGLQETHLLLTGVYTQQSRGHLSQWSGSLCVTKMRPAS